MSLALGIDSAVNETTVSFHHLIDHQELPVFITDLLSALILHTTQRRIIDGVGTGFIGSRVAQIYATVGDVPNDSQTQL